MKLQTIRKMGRYCNDYYEKFPEAIKLKCGYDLDYIRKYVSCKKDFTSLDQPLHHSYVISSTRLLLPSVWGNQSGINLDCK